MIGLCLLRLYGCLDLLDRRALMDMKISAIPVSVMAMVSLNYGLGLHIWDQKPEEWHETYSKVYFPVLEAHQHVH